MKIRESNLRQLVRRKAKAALKERDALLTEDEFTDEEYKEIVDIIRQELVRTFHTFYRKRNFWAR